MHTANCTQPIRPYFGMHRLRRCMLAGKTPKMGVWVNVRGSRVVPIDSPPKVCLYVKVSSLYLAPFLSYFDGSFRDTHTYTHTHTHVHVSYQSAIPMLKCRQFTGCVCSNSNPIPKPNPNPIHYSDVFVKRRRRRFTCTSPCGWAFSSSRSLFDMIHAYTIAHFTTR